MQRRSLLQFVAALGAFPFAARAESSPAAMPNRGDEKRAAAILSAAKSFGRGGGYDKTWKSSGCPAPIEHEGQVILRGSTQGTYCCGLTFAIAVKALTDAGALKKKSAADLKAFQKVWFGATDQADEREKQCALAVGQLGVGSEIGPDKAMAGDFAQLWRVGDRPSGHSVLFLGWILVGKKRVGFSYLSSQGSTDGIGYGVEYFADAAAGDGRVDESRVYFARLKL